MNTVSIAFCFNNAYCALASGAISSLIRNITDKFQYDIYILQDDISEQNKYLINSLNDKNNLEIRFVDIRFDEFTKEDLGYNPRFTKYTFARLFIHKILPHLDKILYLDSDLIVTSDISEAFNQDLDGFSIGVCLDPITQKGIDKLKISKLNAKTPGFEKYPYQYDYFSKYLNMTDDEILSYFSAGVLLLDLKKAGIKLDKLLPKLLIKQYNIVDQDILNIIFKGDKKILDPKFNVFDVRTFQYISENSHNPVIIHYNGPVKPTETMSRPMAYCYWEEVSKTPYYYPAIESFINKQITRDQNKYNDPRAIESLFYNLKRFKGVHRRRRLIRILIRLLVNPRRYQKLKADPSKFFADSKNSFIRFLGKFYN